MAKIEKLTKNGEKSEQIEKKKGKHAEKLENNGEN